MTEEFICKLYGYGNLKEVNTARTAIFKTGRQLEESLPPNQDSLKLHLYRANYQTAIHRQCLEQFPNIPSPDGCGWVLEDGQLQVKWMKLPCAPKAVLEFIHCNCQKSQCIKSSCSCLKNNLKCSDMCMCTDCLNFHHSDPPPKKNELLDDSDSECDMS